MVWHAVCIAAVVAMDKGRRAAWVMRGSRPPEEVVGPARRAGPSAFWASLVDGALTLRVLPQARTPILSQSPFLRWHGGGLRVFPGDRRMA